MPAPLNQALALQQIEKRFDIQRWKFQVWSLLFSGSAGRSRIRGWVMIDTGCSGIRKGGMSGPYSNKRKSQ
ncbi:hypothetical protein [Pseudomonas sp. HMWF006]|uniref:hypothetical protein n=1 Tax=Pseudomonas sp. HMWF006 TaxID=2056843 RepID=UPI000FFB9CB3|nr:hypothetical protein [Pseudomonas sp. HMWF006]